MSKIKSKIIKFLWVAFFLFWGSIIVLFFAIAEGWIGYLPPIEELQNPIDKYASQLISADGQTIGSFAQSGENRILVDYHQLPRELVQALEATEDIRFRQHSGIDFRSLPRVFFKTVVMRQKSAGGGSTITQQLAKQLYSDPVKGLWQRVMQKPIEWVIAVKLERYYTKDEILTMYLNKFDFLYNAVGIKSAAKTYFGKEPKDLSLTESAMLVGMCNNPSTYNPQLRKGSDQPLKRRNIVLARMEKAGYLTSEEVKKYSEEPIILHFTRQTHKGGIAPYLREELRKIMMARKPNPKDYAAWQKQQYRDDSLSWQNDPLYGWCYKNRKSDGSPYNVYTDGLKIYVTIDSRLQQHAEDAVAQHMYQLQKQFDREMKSKKEAPFANSTPQSQRESILNRAMRQSERWRQSKEDGMSEEEIIKSFSQPTEMTVFAWQERKGSKGGTVIERGEKDVTMTPLDSIRYVKGLLRTGFMAMNPRDGHVLAYVGGIDFDHFQYDMVSLGRRQIGSTIKPMLYSLAMIEGRSPCDLVPHVPITIKLPDGRSWTPRNDNRSRIGENVSIQWGLQNSDNWVTAYLMSQTSTEAFLRILRSFGLEGPIDPTPSMSLGTPDASVREMVSAYTAFVNRGIRVSPVLVARIEDAMGNVVSTFTPETLEVLPEEASYKMLYMMQNVINGGSGRRLRTPLYDLGSLPMGGKTGTTQSNSDGWFVGYTPDIVAGCWVGGEEPQIHFNSMAYGQGAASALPIFGYFMKRVYHDRGLGYSLSSQFDLPEGFQPCVSALPLDVYPSTETSEPVVSDEMPEEEFM